MHRIDVHHHIAPPEFAAVIARLQTGQQPLVDWTVNSMRLTPTASDC
jgi:hypothetical protein